jgi:glycosyltransferase involved in cell wall biosynthesis
MNILHIIPNLKKGGAERLCLDTCRALFSVQDDEVMVFNFRPENAYVFLTEKLNRKVIPSKAVPSILGKSTIEVDALQHELEAFQPDVIHVHLFEALMVVCHLRHTAHLVVHFHDNMPQFENFSWRTLFSKKRVTNFLEKQLILKSLKQHKVTFIGISEHTIEYMNKVLPKHAHIVKLLNAIDTQRFYVPPESTRTNELTMIGSLVPKKNQQLAIHVVAELFKRGIDVQLNLLGEGSEREKLEEVTQQLNLAEHIFFRGNVDEPERFLKKSAVYLHTARYEPFGLVILEAMAAGLPVVCADGGGNRDIIRNGQNGFILDTEKPEAFADKIEHLLKNTEQRIRMGSNAQRFAQTFDIKSYAERLMAIYTAKS